jgi:hypothetical protein
MNATEIKTRLDDHGINFLAELAKKELIANKDCSESEFRAPYVLRGRTQDGREFQLFDDWKDFGQRLDLVVTRMERTAHMLGLTLGETKKQQKVIEDFCYDLCTKFDHKSPERDAVLAIGLAKEREGKGIDISKNLVAARLGFDWTGEAEFTLNRMMQLLQTFGAEHFEAPF